MTEQIGLWRASYTPGEWIVLGGPTSLVILQPAPDDMSASVERLWQVVVEADSMDALVTELAGKNVTAMPDFAVFFWHGGTMHSLIRGELEVTDLDTGALVAEGADVQTWTEVGLGAVRRVRIELGAEARTPGLRLPLVVGAVRAGAVELDATELALVHSPQGRADADSSSLGDVAEPVGDLMPRPVPAFSPSIPASAYSPSMLPAAAEIESARSEVVDAEIVDDFSGPASLPVASGGAEEDFDFPMPAASPAGFGQGHDHPFGGASPDEHGESADADDEDAEDEFDPFAHADSVASLFGQVPQRTESSSELPFTSEPQEPPRPAADLAPLSELPFSGGGWSVQQEPVAPPPSQPAQPASPSSPRFAADPHNPFLVPAVQDREDEPAPNQWVVSPPPSPVVQDREDQPAPNQWAAAPSPSPAPPNPPGSNLPGPNPVGPSVPGSAMPPVPGSYAPAASASPVMPVPPVANPAAPPVPGPPPAAFGFPPAPAQPAAVPPPAFPGQQGAGAPPPVSGPPGLRAVDPAYSPESAPRRGRPVLAVLRPSSGQPVEVDRSVLIGRAPQPNKIAQGEPPKLLTVVSPSTDISRTHLQVSLAGHEVVATDLHSTNGTLLIRPGQPEPERLAPGEPVRVFPGCVLDLGDGVTILVDRPS